MKGNEYDSFSPPEFNQDTREYRVALDKVTDLDGSRIVTTELVRIPFFDDLQVTITIE
ncbi:hypothetical protein [Alteribacter keqinensis]|nr:hypothetical protein [Alteribacter keqinensis]